MIRKVAFVFVLGLTIVAAPSSLFADTLYATSITQHQIVSVDTATGNVTIVTTTPSDSQGFGPDSLIFGAQGEIFYSLPSFGQVRRYDPATHSDTLLAGGFTADLLSGPHDLALEPGGLSLLVSDVATHRVYRVILATGQTTLLASLNGPTEGLAYDNTGHLFVNIFDGRLLQLDPITGAVLQQSAIFTSLDGLTFDPASGNLFATSLNGHCLYAFNPNALANSPSCISTPTSPDGVASDGAGHIYVAGLGNGNIYSYSLTGGTFTSVAVVNGLDDIAPASGLGASSVPEPASYMLLLSVLGLLATPRLGKYMHSALKTPAAPPVA